MPKYIKAKAGPRHSEIYTDSDGKTWIFEGGNRPWRNNNPGDVVPGAVSARNGAIGKAGGFAVFPSYESGHAALLDTLSTTYGGKDTPTLIKAFAPPSENDTKAYKKYLQKCTGVFDDKKVKNFTKAEFEELWKAIEQMEGWGKKSGKIRLLETKAKILNVSRDKHGIISAYQIEGYGWVSKDKGIALTEQGKVDAVVAISPAGHAYLRGRPGHAIS